MKRTMGLLLLALAVAAAAPPAGAAIKRSLVVAPFAATTLPREDAWLGDGVAEALTLAFVQHPAFVLIERGRAKDLAESDGRSAEAVVKAARAMRADVAVFGEVRRDAGNLVVHPRYVQFKDGAGEPQALPDMAFADSELLKRLGALPGVYMKALAVPLTAGETSRLEAAARPTTSVRAFQFYVTGRQAALKGGSDGFEAAADLFARAIDVDSTFVVAQYALGTAHQALGNRWKAAAQFRASTQLDPAYPEPYKALGDLFLAAPRRLFDQALEAYSKAVELRPFYAEAWVGLGDARAAKGDVDAAVTAYQTALGHNPLNPRIHASLGKIYFTEKNLYYEAVQAYERAVELDPDFLEARIGLGEVYEEKGLYREAIVQYQKAVELDGKHTGARYNLALVYEKVDPKEAIELWERYIALASELTTEKDWVEVARQHLRKLRNEVRP